MTAPCGLQTTDQAALVPRQAQTPEGPLEALPAPACPSEVPGLVSGGGGQEVAVNPRHRTEHSEPESEPLVQCNGE